MHLSIKSWRFTDSSLKDRLRGACLKDSLNSVLIVHKDDTEVANAASRMRQCVVMLTILARSSFVTGIYETSTLTFAFFKKKQT